MPARAIGKTLLLAVVSLGLLFLLHRLGLIETQHLYAAFADHGLLLWASVGCLVALSVISIVRHKWALWVLGLDLPWGSVAAANLIGQAVGQWAPGSMAVAEIMRIGLLLGGSDGESRRKRIPLIAMASLIDRVVGQGVAFWVASAAAVASALLGGVQQRGRLLLWLVALATFAAGSLLVGLPLFGDTRLFRWLTRRGERQVDATWLRRVAHKIQDALAHLRGASEHWSNKRHAFLVTALLSALAGVLSPLTAYLASLAVGHEIPLLLMIAIVPTTILSVILPVSFAGFGGPQLIAVAHFAPFGVPAQAVMATLLVQASLVLAVQTVLAAGCAALRGKEVALSFRRARAAADAP